MNSGPKQPSVASAPRIAVVGGGISGLAASHRALELIPAARVTLFEASPRLGGVLQTVERDGFLIERSADSFITKIPAALSLCQRIGLAEELIPTSESRRRALVVRNRRLYPIPDGFFVMSPRRLWPMLTTPVLSLRGKLRLLAEPFIPPRQELAADGHSGDENVASFAKRRLGRETYERLVQPLLAGIYTADPAKLSMAATMPEFLDHERRSGSLLLATLKGDTKKSAGTVRASGARYGLFVTPRRGIGMIVDELTERISRSATVRLGTAVRSIARSDSFWCVKYGEPAIGGVEAFDAVILAVPAYRAAEMMLEADTALARELAAIEYAGCAVVSLGFRDERLATRLDSFGVVVPQIEGRAIIAASFSSAKFCGRAPAGGVLIRVFVGGALRPELLKQSDKELESLVLHELWDLLGVREAPIATDVARWGASMPQYHVGHLARVDRIEELTAQLPALELAGNAYRGVGIPQCISSGERAAERIVESWRRSPPK